MRILHIVGTMSAESGGPAEAIRMLVEFAPPDVTSEIVSCDHTNEPALATLTCKVHALGHRKPGFFYSRKLITWLRLNRDRFDGVIVHGLWTYPSYAAWRTLTGRTPYVVFAHGMLDPWFKRAFPLKHMKKWAYWLVIQYWILRRAHRVLFTTASERDLASQSFWLHRWTPAVVPLGAQSSAPADNAAREAFYKLCPEVRDRRFLLYLGRIDPKKGCDILIQAFGDPLLTDDDLQLVIAGPDPNHWRPALEATATQHSIADRVHWPGMVNGIAKTAAFDLCEAFILPSHQENFGIAVVEALAAARPVLISDKINIAPEIAADKCGLVEPDDLMGTISLLINWEALSTEQRAAMSTQALATFETRYDMRRNTEAILRVFDHRRTAH
ncbi:MAG: glycosyltransferase [Acidobacteriaceae bacterium]